MQKGRGRGNVHCASIEDMSELMQCIATLVFVWTMDMYSIIKNNTFSSLCSHIFVVVGFIRWRWRQHKQQSTSADQRSFKVIGARY